MRNYSQLNQLCLSANLTLFWNPSQLYQVMRICHLSVNLWFISAMKLSPGMSHSSPFVSQRKGNQSHKHSNRLSARLVSLFLAGLNHCSLSQIRCKSMPHTNCFGRAIPCSLPVSPIRTEHFIPRTSQFVILSRLTTLGSCSEH